MTREHYNPVPLGIPPKKKRWSKDPAFAETYDALADEFIVLGELVRARRKADAAGCELHTTLAPKPGTSRRSKTAAS